MLFDDDSSFVRSFIVFLGWVWFRCCFFFLSLLILRSLSIYTSLRHVGNIIICYIMRVHAHTIGKWGQRRNNPILCQFIWCRLCFPWTHKLQVFWQECQSIKRKIILSTLLRARCQSAIFMLTSFEECSISMFFFLLL